MIIGLSGKMHAGKDTVFQEIRRGVDALGLQAERRLEGWGENMVQRLAFADALKESLAETFGIMVEELEAAKDKGTVTLHLAPNMHVSLTIRELLQRYGNEGHREVFGEDFWITWLEYPSGAPRHWNNDRLYVVTDVRFQNEADWIHSKGGFVVEVRRVPEDPLPADCPHASELGVKPDWVLLNPVGDPVGLHHNVNAMLLFVAMQYRLPL